MDSGELITGQTVNIAYYTQEIEEMDENMRMIAYIRGAGEIIETNKGKSFRRRKCWSGFFFLNNTHGTPIR